MWATRAVPGSPARSPAVGGIAQDTLLGGGIGGGAGRLFPGNSDIPTSRQPDADAPTTPLPDIDGDAPTNVRPDTPTSPQSDADAPTSPQSDADAPGGVSDERCNRS